MIWPSAVMLESFGATDAEVSPLDGGHVHQTFAVHPRNGRLLLVQAVNPSVTGDAWTLAERTLAVSDALLAHPDPMLTDRQAMRTRAGEAAVRDANGVVWRAFELIDRAVAADKMADPPSPGTVAHLFGRFGRRASEARIPAFATRPFHDLPRRLEQWDKARAEPAADAPASLVSDLDELLHRVEPRTGLPSRTVHNDAKPANLLVDLDTGSPLAIIDLDLVDQGTIADDLGDLVRSQVFPGEALDLDRLTEVIDGYLQGLEPLLGHGERIGVSRSGELITLELAVRRLTDHVSGAGYFADADPGENIEQAHRQLARVRQLLANRDEVDVIARRLTDAYRAPSTH